MIRIVRISQYCLTVFHNTLSIFNESIYDVEKHLLRVHANNKYVNTNRRVDQELAAARTPSLYNRPRNTETSLHCLPRRLADCHHRDRNMLPIYVKVHTDKLISRPC